MRHSKVINHLGRTSSHRKAMLANMATSLILHKRIATTTAKAKETDGVPMDDTPPLSAYDDEPPF